MTKTCAIPAGGNDLLTPAVATKFAIRAKVADMKTTTLERSGLRVSHIASGTWQLGGEWGSFDEDAPVAEPSPETM
ncbi:hypothetical protein [Nocardia sp. NPDC005998]|uniref:hypothetical protein n=1 Tax=Nocardia sp. NPDC005998 TaxID=3156894 RepID=UPI0033B08EB5